MTITASLPDSLDRSVETANVWIDEVADELDGDRLEGYRALRAYLHTLRDRLPAQQSALLAAQLPTLLRGVFWEGWQPSRTPLHYRDPVEFSERVRREARLIGDTEAWFAVEAAAKVLRRHVDEEAIQALVRSLPESLQGFVAC